MQKTEIRAAFSLSALFCLRMLGLFMILPVFTPYAKELQGATPFLIGAALGIYGLTQAIFQIPLGTLSDYYPRKLIIAGGFLLFIIGSLICALSYSITGVLIGRALQGAGAIGSTLTALLTDLVRPEKRSKAMTILGIMIACAFLFSMIAGPLLTAYISVKGIFMLTGVLGLLGLILLFTIVPPSHLHQKIIGRNFSLRRLIILFQHPQLLTLNLSIFFLHFILTASFIVIPLWILHWTAYIWPLTLSFVLTFILIGYAEKNKKVMNLCYCAIAGLGFAELCLNYLHGYGVNLFSAALTLFFLSFNLLEANLPSIVSRVVPIENKGSAMGIYSTCQFLGIFCGGVFGGAILQYFSAETILLSCGFIAIAWLIFALIIRHIRSETWQEV